MTDTTPLPLRVNAVAYEAAGINSFELVDPLGNALPPFTAGAHIDIDLPNGLSRSYSLINPQGERNRYQIAVNNDAAGRGGSKYLHEQVRVGDVLPVRPPRNNFVLHEDAAATVLIAGGIGITPLLTMIQRLEHLKRNWQLYYCVRTRQQMAFRDPLLALEQQKPGRVHFNFDHETDGKLLDIVAVLKSVSADAHVYCCGPLGMLSSFEAAFAGRPAECMHVEYFTPKPFVRSTASFSVVLARSNRRFQVPADRSILDILLEQGVNPPYSCKEGVCGTCEVRVLEGTPEHRDSVLSEPEKAANRTMMICCSRAKSPSLTIDL